MLARIVVPNGARFGRWTVIDEAPERRNHCRYFFCRCDCGTERQVSLVGLRHGTSHSCGCLSVERTTTHGDSAGYKQTREYRAWMNMRERCRNPRNRWFHNYGGRGIHVCAAWENYATFLGDVGRCPSPELTLDRIDNDGQYEPGNVRWTTRTEQSRNRRPYVFTETRRVLLAAARARHTRFITFENVTLSIAAWARRIGIRPQALHGRLRHLPVAEALTKPRRHYPHP